MLFVFGPGSHDLHAERLVAACEDLRAAARAGALPAAARSGPGWEGVTAGAGVTGGGAPLPPQRMAPRAAFFAPSEAVATDAAVGRICAELLCPYPPGVPVLCPGEAVTREALASLRRAVTGGGVVVGASDPCLRTLRVVDG